MAKRQLEVPGTEKKANKEICAAAAAYEAERNKRMVMSKEEKAAKLALIATMKKHGETLYRDDEAVPPILIVVSTKDDVKVTRVHGVEEAEEVGGDA